tara:strand:+ start:326 stop:709 length:384 start_codon:yes stop_codon:yes gene_type:complete
MPAKYVWSANGTRVLSEDYDPPSPVTRERPPPSPKESNLYPWKNILKDGITWVGKGDQEKAAAISKMKRSHRGRITKRQRGAIMKREMIIASERGVKTAEEQREILRLAAEKREIDRMGKNYNSLKN